MKNSILFRTVLQETGLEVLRSFFNTHFIEASVTLHNTKIETNLENPDYYTIAIEILEESKKGHLFLQIQYSKLTTLIDTLLGSSTNEDIEDCSGEVLNIISGKFRNTLKERTHSTEAVLYGSTPYKVSSILYPPSTIEYLSSNATFILGYSLPV